MENKQLLLDFVCTSKNVSGFSGKRPSLSHAAILYAKIEGLHDGIVTHIKQKHEGKDEDFITGSKLKKRQEKLKNLIKRLESEAYKQIPVNKGYEEYEKILTDIGDEDLQNYGRTLNRYCYEEEKKSVTLIDFSDESRGDLIESLIKLSKPALKLETLAHIEEEILLYDVYHYYDRFERVPDACRYYAEELGEDFDFDVLKEKIRDKARIMDDGKILDEWDVIAKRIHSWKQHEKKKPNRKYFSS